MARSSTGSRKEAELKGPYLHAAEWGQPESKSIDAVTRPKLVPGHVETKTARELSSPARKEKTAARSQKEAAGAVPETSVN